MSKRENIIRLKDAALGCLDAIDVLQHRRRGGKVRILGSEGEKQYIAQLKDQIETGNRLLPTFKETLCRVRVPSGNLDLRFTLADDDNLEWWIETWQDIQRWSAHAAALRIAELFWEHAVAPDTMVDLMNYLYEKPPSLLDEPERREAFHQSVSAFPRLLGPAALRAQIEQEAEHLLQELVDPKAGESGRQDDTQDDNDKKRKKYKRKMNQAALVCADRYREAKRKKPETTMEEVVQGYVDKNPEESYSSIWRTLNDNPDQWKT